jgi:predicted metal-dependent HD superfamily phosphohydrolase
LGKLRDRFCSLWQRHAIAGQQDIANNVFDLLCDKYQEPWRSYHNLNHILDCLNHFDACKKHAQFADAIEFAIWFHDCIYEVGAGDNEARSRDWFLEQTDGFLRLELRTVIAKLIMATSLHSTPETSDGRLLADIDLTSFGLPWHEYLQDSMAVQSELMRNKNSGSDAGKIKFLKSLSAKGSIYYSSYYLDHFEDNAKKNVRNHLKLLSEQSQSG